MSWTNEFNVSRQPKKEILISKTFLVPCVVCSLPFEAPNPDVAVGICEPCFVREQRMKRVNRAQWKRGERRYKVGIVKCS
jgi:hypothetical protein